MPGKSSGSPVIWENRVFIVSAVPTSAQSQPSAASSAQSGNRGGRRGRRGPAGGGALPELEFRVMCFDRKTGKQLWNQLAVTATPHEGTHSTNGFASASPCTDGQNVYAHFGSRGLFCYSVDGELQWSRTDLGKMQMRAGFGEGSSPTLAGDKVILPLDHEGASKLYALNKATGDTIWSVDRDEPSCWATPLVVNRSDSASKQVVMNGQNYARGYDLETGKELWRCSGQTQRPVASPVANENAVYVGSGFRGSFLGAFKLDATGDIAGSNSVAWTVSQDTPDIASPVLSGNRMYYHKEKTGILTCVDVRTGEPLFERSRLPDIRSTYASPIAAGGYVFATGRSGKTVVIKDADKLEVVSVNDLGEGVDATPAAVDNELFIRGENHLFCIRAE
ncbi:MAG: PQQ-like beta-propeller repeat protein [Aureliella sp.]